jgi:hypothetical protein
MFRKAGKTGLPGTFAQITHFSCPFYFTQAAFRCFHATSVASFHNGILRRQPPHPSAKPGRVTKERKTVANKTSSKSGNARRNSTKPTRKSASRATKSGAKRETVVTENSLGDDEVSLDRRRTDRRDDQASVAAPPTMAGPQLERRKKVNRRRQIDPTT